MTLSVAFLWGLIAKTDDSGALKGGRAIDYMLFGIVLALTVAVVIRGDLAANYLRAGVATASLLAAAALSYLAGIYFQDPIGWPPDDYVTGPGAVVYWLPLYAAALGFFFGVLTFFAHRAFRRRQHGSHV